MTKDVKVPMEVDSLRFDKQYNNLLVLVHKNEHVIVLDPTVSLSPLQVLWGVQMACGPTIILIHLVLVPLMLTGVVVVGDLRHWHCC